MIRRTVLFVGLFCFVSVRVDHTSFRIAVRHLSMQTLAFDGQMGASGDMILGTLLAAGATSDALAPVENTLDVTYGVETVIKNGICATSADVRLTGDEESDGDDKREHTHEHTGTHDHDHDSHDHDHTGEHDHNHNHDHAEGSGPLRTYPEVIDIVESMDLPSEVKENAKSVFRLLGEAEAQVHDTALEETHFHEVGADDAIADIVGACLLFHDLAIDRIVTTPVATGSGAVSMSHGTYPIPAPAVVNITAEADWELRGGPVEAELLTPTGAAILAHFAEGVETLPALTVDRSGYGAGGYDFPEHPNVLRAIVGHSRGGLVRDDIRVLETNLDDTAPEILGGLHDTLMDAGARDVSILSASMKKSRPGHLVKVIVKPEDTERVADRLARETGTLGIRETGVRHRFIAERSFETVSLSIDGDSYEVTVKLASDTDGDVYDVSAEYDDATAVANETRLATREIIRRAEEAVSRSS
jgi:uncharacterized protein (TIGR00299 family) protein